MPPPMVGYDTVSGVSSATNSADLQGEVARLPSQERTRGRPVSWNPQELWMNGCSLMERSGFWGNEGEPPVFLSINYESENQTLNLPFFFFFPNRLVGTQVCISVTVNSFADLCNLKKIWLWVGSKARIRIGLAQLVYEPSGCQFLFWKLEIWTRRTLGSFKTLVNSNILFLGKNGNFKLTFWVRQWHKSLKTQSG